jgi:uncharacterized membrane protein
MKQSALPQLSLRQREAARHEGLAREVAEPEREGVQLLSSSTTRGEALSACLFLARDAKVLLLFQIQNNLACFSKTPLPNPDYKYLSQSKQTT